MFTELRSTDCLPRRALARRVIAVAAGALLVVATADLSADRRSSGGSVRQSRTVSSDTRANRSTSASPSTNRNMNCNTNVNRNTNVNLNVNVNNNVK